MGLLHSLLPSNAILHPQVGLQSHNFSTSPLTNDVIHECANYATLKAIFLFLIYVFDMGTTSGKSEKNGLTHAHAVTFFLFYPQLHLHHICHLFPYS